VHFLMQFRHIRALPSRGLECNNFSCTFVICNSSAAPDFESVEIDFLALTEGGLGELGGLDDINPGRQDFHGKNWAAIAPTAKQSADLGFEKRNIMCTLAW